MLRMFACLCTGDMTDSTNLIRIVQETQPDEIYNLAAQSHVKVSFETPEYTANAAALETLRILEALSVPDIEKTVRFYQASTSELYGKVTLVGDATKARTKLGCNRKSVSISLLLRWLRATSRPYSASPACDVISRTEDDWRLRTHRQTHSRRGKPWDGRFGH